MIALRSMATRTQFVSRYLNVNQEIPCIGVQGISSFCHRPLTPSRRSPIVQVSTSVSHGVDFRHLQFGLLLSSFP